MDQLYLLLPRKYTPKPEKRSSWLHAFEQIYVFGIDYKALFSNKPITI